MTSSKPLRFDLLSEPWIPMVDSSGKRLLQSLRGCLLGAADYRAIDSTNPTELFALQRLLLAICHRAFGPGSLDDRGELLDHWPAERLDAYLSQWASRFDLFDPARPFMQVAGLGTASKLQPSPWTRMALGMSTGAAKLLFDHTLDEAPPAADVPLLARVLLSHLQFTPGGLVKALRTSGARGAGAAMLLVAPVGRSLAETLALSLIPQSAAEFALDIPPWEQDELDVAMLAAPPERAPAGPAQRYSWLSRALLLRSPADGAFPTVLYAEGLPLPQGPVPDPMAITLRNDKGAFPLQLNPERAFWRDFHALTSEQRGIPPAVISHAIAMRLARDEFDPVELVAGGLLPDDAKLIFWRIEERRIAPAVLAADHAAGARVAPALELAEAVGRQFEQALWAMVAAWLQGQTAHAPPKKEIRNALQGIGGSSQFWVGMEPEFWRFIDALGAHADPDTSFRAWQSALAAGVRKAWQWSVAQMGGSTRALTAAAQAEHLMWVAVRAATQP